MYPLEATFSTGGANNAEQRGTYMTEIVFGGIAQELHGREFEFGEVRFAVFRRFDDGEVGIRNFGTKEGTQRGKVIFDEHHFNDVVAEALGSLRERTDREIAEEINRLYENAAQ